MQIPAALPPNGGYDIISESTQTDDSDSLNASADLATTADASTGSFPVEVDFEEEEEDSSETSSVMERLSRRVREGMGLWDERQDRATQVSQFDTKCLSKYQTQHSNRVQIQSEGRQHFLLCSPLN